MILKGVHYYKQFRKHAAEANDEMWSGLEARFNASFSAQFHEFGLVVDRYTVKTELREVLKKCFDLKQKCLVAAEISHAVFHNSDTECLVHPNSYL